MWGLLLEVLRVVDDMLDWVHVVLQFGDLTNQPSERLLGADYVAEREAGLSGGDGEAGGDGENGDDEGEEETEHVDSNTQSTLVRDSQPVSPGTERSVLRMPSDGGANKPVFDVHPPLALLPDRSVSPYARIVARPARDSEKRAYNEDRRMASNRFSSRALDR